MMSPSMGSLSSRVGMGDPLGGIRGTADVVPVDGVLLKAPPGFLFQLEPVPLRAAAPGRMDHPGW